MLKKLQALIVICLAVAIAAPGLAADKKKKKGKKGNRQRQNRVIAQVKKRLQKAELTAEQKEKLDKLAAEYGPKIVEAQKAVFAVLTPEYRKARAAAVKKFRAEGKKGKELNKAVAAEIKLSDDDAKKLKEAQAGVNKLRMEMNKAVVAMLTPEQREKAGFKGRKRGKKGAKKGKKKAKKKADA